LASAPESDRVVLAEPRCLVVVVADEAERRLALDERVARFSVILQDRVAPGVLAPELALDFHHVPRWAQLVRRPDSFKFKSIILLAIHFLDLIRIKQTLKKV